MVTAVAALTQLQLEDIFLGNNVTPQPFYCIIESLLANLNPLYSLIKPNEIISYNLFKILFKANKV